jgi:hypothetical protein
MANVRIRKYANKQEMERAVDEFVTLGYDIKERGEETILVKKHDNGSLLAHIILAVLGWWLIFIPNIIYLLYKRSRADQVLMKLDMPEPQVTFEAPRAQI